MVKQKLHSCSKCGMVSEYLQTIVHAEINRGELSKKFYILCACPDPPKFDSEKEAWKAWNIAHAPFG